MEIHQKFRYRYFRSKKGWRVAASAVEGPDGFVEFITYTGVRDRTKQWQKQILDPRRGWTTMTLSDKRFGR